MILPQGGHVWSALVPHVTVHGDCEGSPIWVHCTTPTQGEAQLPSPLEYEAHVQTLGLQEYA